MTNTFVDPAGPPSSCPKGILIGAPASGSGKTTVTLGLLRALVHGGYRAASAKIGPDYIDPAFHRRASGRACLNLDLWAMRDETVVATLNALAEAADIVVAEGVMGLFDGANDGAGSTAAVAERTGWPVLLVIDASGMAASAAAVVHGFATFRPEVAIAGVIFNRVGSAAHTHILREALAPLGIPMVGALPRNEAIALPERHLGLVQADEHPDFEAFVEAAAAHVRSHIDLEQVVALATPSGLETVGGEPGAFALPPLGQRIAVAADVAFQFAYPAVLRGWQAAGAEVTFFSPLNDEAPRGGSDAVYLPGGYPELHAGALAANGRFLQGVRDAARRGAVVYGECGGYMTLGTTLIDKEAVGHEMLGLLPVETSFAAPRLTLGYRQLALRSNSVLGDAGTSYRGHEFHYASIVCEGRPPALFNAKDARGNSLDALGAEEGSVFGSFAHLIDRSEAR